MLIGRKDAHCCAAHSMQSSPKQTLDARVLDSTQAESARRRLRQCRRIRRTWLYLRRQIICSCPGKSRAAVERPRHSTSLIWRAQMRWPSRAPPPLPRCEHRRMAILTPGSNNSWHWFQLQWRLAQGWCLSTMSAGAGPMLPYLSNSLHMLWQSSSTDK